MKMKLNFRLRWLHTTALLLAFAGVVSAQVKIGDNPNTLASGAIFQVEKGGQQVVVNSAGNLGIGLTTPSDKADVLGILRLTNSGGSYSQVSDNLGLKLLSGGTNPMTFFTSNTERMRLDPSGNLGLGTNAPAFVNGGSGMEIKGSNGLFKISHTNGRTTEFIQTGAQFNISSDPGNAYASSDINFLVNGSNVMTVNESLNVGIGTTSPEGKLSVIGSNSNGSYRYGVRVDASNTLGASENAYGIHSFVKRSASTHNSSALHGFNSIAGSSYLTGNHAYQEGVWAFGTYGNVVGNSAEYSGAGITNTAGGYFYNNLSGASDYGVFAGGGSKNYFEKNVGIGTTSPTAKLAVQSTANTAGSAGMLVNNGPYGTTVVPGDLKAAIATHGTYAAGMSATGMYAVVPTGGHLPQTSAAVLEGVDHNRRIYFEGTHLGSTAINRPAMHVVRGGNTDFILDYQGNVGIGTSTPSHPLHLASGAHCTSGGVFTNASDARLKTNVSAIGYGLKEVNQLRPVHYDMKKGGEAQVGFIAQEVKALMPELISGTEGDLEKGETLGMSYGNLTAVLTKAIQELSAKVEQLEAEKATLTGENAQLTSDLNDLRSDVQAIKAALGITAAEKK